MMMMTALIMICLRRRWQQIRLRESDEADNEEVKNIMIIVIVTILCKCRGLTIRCKLVHMERMKFLGKAKAWQWNRDFNAEVEHEFLYGSWAFELLRGATLQNVLSLTRDCQPQCGPDSLLWIWLRFLKENYDKQKRIYCWEYSIYVKGILCKKNYFALIRVWCNFKQCRHVSAQSIFMQDPKRNMRNGTPASLTLRVAPAWSCHEYNYSTRNNPSCTAM